jgi:uncharacterized protein (TIGR02271 family)
MTYDTTAPAGTRTMRTVTAMFETRPAAENAMARLRQEGLPDQNISLVAGPESETHSIAPEAGDNRGFWEQLKDMFFPENDRQVYAEGLRRGGFLVCAATTEDRYERVLDILDDEGSIDMDQRETEWRAQGWGGTGMGMGEAGIGAAAGATGGAGERSMRAGETSARGAGEASMRGSEEQVIPIAQEELRVGKRDVGHGRFRVRSFVVEIPINEQVDLRRERVNVERRPADRSAAAGDDAFRERTIEAEERAEEPVVSKDARVTEEVVVSKDVEHERRNVSDTVRRTEVEIEDERNRSGTPGGQGTPSRGR